MVASVRSVRQPGKNGQLCCQAAQRTTTSLNIAGGIDGDTAQPGRKFRLAPKAPDFLDQRAADVLGDIVGIGPRAGQLPGKTMNPVVVPAEQGFERGAVAGNRRGDQVSIRILGRAPHHPD